MYHNLPMYEHENIRIWECICIYSIYIYIYIHTCRTYIYIDMHAYNEYLHTYYDESLCKHLQSKIKNIAVMTNGAVTGGSPWNLGRHVRDRKATGKRLARKAPEAVTNNCHQLPKNWLSICPFVQLEKGRWSINQLILWTLEKSHQPLQVSLTLKPFVVAWKIIDDQNIYFQALTAGKGVHSWLV